MSPETTAERRRRAGRIVRKLAAAYPDIHCALDFRDPFESFVATILSAQCIDEKVNGVTPALFARYAMPESRRLHGEPDAGLETVTTFSVRPLRFASLLGFVVRALGLTEMGDSPGLYKLRRLPVPRDAYLSVGICMFVGICTFPGIQLSDDAVARAVRAR